MTPQASDKVVSSSSPMDLFGLVDGICRRVAAPSGASLLLRASCLLAMDEVESAREEAWTAWAADGADPAIQRLLLALDPWSPQAMEVAARLIGAPDASEDHLRSAAAVLLRAEDSAILCRRDALGVSAVVAWRRPGSPLIRVDGREVAIDHRCLDPSTGTMVARWRVVGPSDAGCEIRAAWGDGADKTVRFPAARRYGAAPSPFHRVPVSVIVPVYGGLAATRTCLDALAAQTCLSRMQVIVVDDASPDPVLSRWAEGRCRAEGWGYVRQDANKGFAAAINRGAAQADGQNLLLLNADAMLPGDAVDRLLEAAREPRVGTVVPFSNDGGFASFPGMRHVNAVPAPADAARFDAAARAAAPCRAVDIPSGTAFCMLVTRCCWEAAGGLSLDYGRGYFEDVDLCLRARRLGYRNVLAPGLFVTHVGSQSFSDAKRALVARNALLIRDRFPDYDSAWASFVDADPLRRLRSAMEERLPPPHPVRLLVGRPSHLGPWAASRSVAMACRGDGVIGLAWGRDGRIVLRAADGGVPQSLEFGPEASSSYEEYLRALDLRGFEIAEPHAVPDHVLAPLLRTGAPLSISVVGRAAARALGDGTLRWTAGAEILAGDRMAAAALGQLVAPATPGPAREPRDGTDGVPVRLAALAPVATAAADRLLVGLDRALRSAGGELVVFGQAWGGGRAFPKATGLMPPGDYPAAVRHRRITHLLLPDPDLPFGLVDDLRGATARPAAYVDWSGGRVAPVAGDLALAEGRTDDEMIAEIAAWCGAGPGLAGRGFAPSDGPAP